MGRERVYVEIRFLKKLNLCWMLNVINSSSSFNLKPMGDKYDIYM